MKFGICSEIFQAWNDLERAIAYSRALGYDGIEIAPFTLAQKVADIPQSARERIVQKADEAGIEIIGIHWILVGPEGLYINHPDKAVRGRTVQYLQELARFCGDIGGKLAIFGSPKQRNVHPSLTYEQAFEYAVEAFKQAVPAYEEHGVTLCMEPLSTDETNFCCTAAQAAQLADAVGHPYFRMMLDTKAMATEQEDRPALIRKYASYLRHYHANDANRNGPGWGDTDFKPIFRALHDIGYDGYASVEVFNFEPGPEAIAVRSLAYMKEQWASIQP